MLDTVQNSLKAVYLSLGGNADAVRDTEDLNVILNAIAALNIGGQLASAASELPTVTADDDDKVLTVVDGKWAAAAVPKELPTVTGDDDNKVLTVVSGEWAAADLPS